MSGTDTKERDTTTDEQQIRRLISDRVNAMKSADVAASVARLATEAVRFGLAPPLVVRGPEVRDMNGLQAWFDTFDGAPDYEVRDLEVAVGGDVAFCHSLNRLTATPKGQPEPFTLWLRATIGLRRIDERWEVVHEHESTPFYMDGSFRACVDLEP